MDALVEIKNLSKRFGPLTAVDDISFAVARGEVLGFLGPNGAGKSTTMKMITGFLRPDAGTVAIAGDPMAEQSISAKARIGYLPEGAPLYGDMTPRAFLRFMAEIRGIPAASRETRINETVSKTSLEQVLEKPIDNLSKGFKRRVGLAQAILHDPQVLILDEPTDGLDPNQKHEVRQLIRGMAAEKAIILSTHILEEVEAVCTRAIIISAGRVVSDGTPEELVSQGHYHNAVRLKVVSGDSEGIRRALQSLSGVAEVEELDPTDDRSVSVRVVPQSGQCPIVDVSHMARDNGWEVMQLELERGRLDDVFRDITSAESGLS